MNEMIRVAVRCYSISVVLYIVCDLDPFTFTSTVWAALERVKNDSILPTVNLIAEFVNSGCNAHYGLGK